MSEENSVSAAVRSELGLGTGVVQILPGQRFDVVLCYWGSPLLPIIFYLLRRATPEHRAVRFHAVQGVPLALLICVPYVNVLALLLLAVLGAMAIGGRGLRLPLLGAVADAIS
jgi:uncharacterized membrane protein